MLHIFLTILKIPFILLAVLLLLLLAVMLVLLFVPVRYQASAKKDESIEASVRVTWLLHFLSVRAVFLDKKLQLTVKICGWPLIGSKKTHRQKKKRTAVHDTAPEAGENLPKPAAEERNEKIADAAKTVTEIPAMPGENEEELHDIERAVLEHQETECEPETKKPSRQTDQAAPNASAKPRISIFEKLRMIFCNIKKRIESFFAKLQNLKTSIERLKAQLDAYSRLWHDTHTQACVAHIKKELHYLMKHYFPGKIEGKLLFGLSDPAMTGQVLGILSIIQVFTGNHLLVDADFEKPVLEGEIALKGHIRACHVLKAVLALLFDKHCRITVKRGIKLVKKN